MKLNDADSIYVGATPVDKVYAGANLVWEKEAEGPFVPTDIAGLQVWVDASQAVSLNPWNNLGAGPDLVVINPTLPTIQPPTLNGLPVVRYTRDQGAHRISTGTGVAFDFTLFHLSRMWGPNTGRIVTAQFPPGGNLVVGFWNGFKDVGYAGAFYGAQTPVVTGEWKLYTVDCDLATREPRLLSDGMQVGVVYPTPPCAEGFGGSFAINGYDGSTAETCDCEVAEVLLYNHKLSDAAREQVLDYLRAKWLTAPPVTGPDASLLTSYTPGADRDDFTGEVGVRINTDISRTYSWLGMLVHPGNSGVHRVSVYEWFSGTVTAFADFDVTGKTPGTWMWMPITPFTPAADGYIAVLKTVTSGSGQPWYNEGATTFATPDTGDIYATYKMPGGGLSVSAVNSQYVGLDLGWNT